MPEEREYINRLRKVFPHRCEAEIELLCAADLQIQKVTQVSAHEHRRRGMEKLFPSRVWHEWRDERIKSVQFCLERRIQELMWIGSSNSNKSADMADIILSLWWSKPESTTVYVASPYESATETGVWSYILEQFDEAKDHNPTLPGRKKTSDNSIVHFDRNPRSFIRVATVDQVGKLVGKKSRKFDDGLLIIALDELPAFTVSAARALMRVMPNLLSVPNILVLGAGNFANIWDALGVFCDPSEKDIPGGYSAFDPDKHFRWRSKRGGLVLRFDGLQSPNVKAGQDVYPFLTTIRYINKLASAPGGLQSPDAMRFIRSAPVTSLDEKTVISGERLRAGGCFDKYEWTSDPVESGAFIDPGFGGDACVIQKFKVGYIRIPDGKRQSLALWDEPVEIPVRVGLKDAAGIEIPVERQIVEACRKHCESFRIPVKNIGYDGSMRSEFTQAMGHWSLQLKAVDSMGPATSREYNALETHAPENGRPGKPVTWKEKVDRLISEFWFAAASLIDSFQLRGLQLSPKAAQQLTMRRWDWIGKKKKGVQTKQEYKDDMKAMALSGESPNEADALVGCIEVARDRMGLRLMGVAPLGGSLEMVLQMIREREMRQVMHNLQNRSGLPSGHLHAIKPTGAQRSGTLHRR